MTDPDTFVLAGKVVRWAFYIACSFFWIGCMFLLLARRWTPFFWGGLAAALLLVVAALWLDPDAFAVTRYPFLFHGSMAMIFVAAQVLLWRYVYFFRDPRREVPKDAALVAPADGFVSYVRQIDAGQVPLAVKNGTSIPLPELMGGDYPVQPGATILGIFMTPMSVHINRAPVAGRIASLDRVQPRSMVGMMKMQLRLIFGRKPYEVGSDYIVSNQRETMLIDGPIPVYLVRIADPYVKSIVTDKRRGDAVTQGERIGMIRMGSQCDIIFPPAANGEPLRVCVREGEYVYGGRTVLAR